MSKLREAVLELVLRGGRYNGFAESAARKGWAEMADPSNWPKWGYDNNDGDVCCTSPGRGGEGRPRDLALRLAGVGRLHAG